MKNAEMKLVQAAGSLTYGDGVMNCILALDEVLRRAGYKSVIAARNVDSRLEIKDVIQFGDIEEIGLNENDILIYHLYIGTDLNRIVERLPYKKILVYHNVTPAKYFREVDDNLATACLYGVLDAETTAGNYLRCITMSEFSKGNLVEYGWRAEDIEAIPLINGYPKRENEDIDNAVLEKYSDGFHNFLFVGRIVPHKKIEDIIRIFAYYQKNICSDARLLLVGSIGYKNYYNALKKYIEELDVQNIILTGHVPNEALEAYYSVSDLFLCMSEHEGFCMPLIEAMGRGLPVLAYAAAAVPETMGNAGILLESKDEAAVCRYIDNIFRDKQYREKIIMGEQERVRQINIGRYEDRICSLINDVADIEEYTYKSEEEILRIEPDRIEINQWEILKSKILIKDDVSIIVYGIGKIGKQLFSELLAGGCSQIAAICDNNFQDKIFMGVPVLKHDECMKRYPDAIYIVTIQIDHVQIISDLLKSGIYGKQIVYWGNKRGFYV